MRLTPSLLKLMEHEAAMERCTCKADMRWLLGRVESEQLYRARGFDSMADYCKAYLMLYAAATGE